MPVDLSTIIMAVWKIHACKPHQLSVQNAGLSYAAAACPPELKAPNDFSVNEVKRDNPFAYTLVHDFATLGTTASSYGFTS